MVVSTGTALVGICLSSHQALSVSPCNGSWMLVLGLTERGLDELALIRLRKTSREPTSGLS
jgi:hypothetical protein